MSLAMLSNDLELLFYTCSSLPAKANDLGVLEPLAERAETPTTE